MIVLRAADGTSNNVDVVEVRAVQGICEIAGWHFDNGTRCTRDLHAFAHTVERSEEGE